MCFAACEGDDDDDPGVTSSRPKDAGARNEHDGSSSGGGKSGSGGRGGAQAGSGGMKTDAATATGGSGSAGRGGTGGRASLEDDPSKCGGVTCPPPTVCDHTGNPPFCACPPGSHFVDVGGGESPCAEDCTGDCDAGS